MDDLPFYAETLKALFPFRHTQLWADANVSELRKFTDGYSAIAKLVRQSDLATIRNGIDHYRDERSFPDSDKMLAMVARLQLALDQADVNRYLPKICWLYSRRANRFGFVEYEYRDYSGRTLRMFGPPMVSGVREHLYSNPVVIAPLNLLGHPNAQLFFRSKESSEYSFYWHGYPRRRQITADQTERQNVETGS